MAEERLDILVIGAGFAGLCAAIRLRQAGKTGFAVVDANAGVGGTWYANTYPGATCDVPSHFYSFSFAPKADWSHLYSPQPEILAYLQDCVTRFGLAPYLRLGRRVTELAWDSARTGWAVALDDGTRLFARFVINGAGGLQVPQWPAIEGLEQFTGPKMHTAAWNHAVDFAGKRVAVIGSAASAIQVVPELARVAAQVDVWQRTPNYIAPRGNRAYSARQKRLFALVPGWRRLYRWIIKTRMDLVLFPLVTNPERRAKFAARIRAYIARAARDPALAARLTPDYEIGCKRILVSDDFFATLRRRNVTLQTGGIARIAPEGVVAADGSLHPADVLVCATGFDFGAQYTAMPIRGRDGRTLAEHWAEQVEAWRGVMVTGFPNLFLVTGPNSGVGTTSVVHMIEQAVGWILRTIDRVPPGQSVEVRAEAQAAWNRSLHAALDQTVWATGCHSWYKRADGRIETLYPGSAAMYAREMRRARLSDLRIGAAP